MKMNNPSGKSLFATLTIAFMALLFTGCSKNSAANTDSLYTPTAADVTATASLADLQAGRIDYINSCGRCHNLYSPDNFSASNWKSIVPNMAGRAGMMATETAQVTKYVTRGK